MWKNTEKNIIDKEDDKKKPVKWSAQECSGLLCHVGYFCGW